MDRDHSLVFSVIPKKSHSDESSIELQEFDEKVTEDKGLKLSNGIGETEIEI